MKRLIPLVPLLFTFMVISGCGKEKFPMNELAKEDFAAISVDGEKTITFDMKRAEIQNILGEPSEDSDVWQSYDDKITITYSEKNKEVTTYISLISSFYHTPRNITVGDTLEAVKKAYGDNPHVYGDLDEKNGIIHYEGNLDGKNINWHGKTLDDFSEEEQNKLKKQVELTFFLENGYVRTIQIAYSAITDLLD